MKLSIFLSFLCFLASMIISAITFSLYKFNTKIDKIKYNAPVDAVITNVVTENDDINKIIKATINYNYKFNGNSYTGIYVKKYQRAVYLAFEINNLLKLSKTYVNSTNPTDSTLLLNDINYVLILSVVCLLSLFILFLTYGIGSCNMYNTYNT